jgi:hypothetical protein
MTIIAARQVETYEPVKANLAQLIMVFRLCHMPNLIEIKWGSNLLIAYYFSVFIPFRSFDSILTSPFLSVDVVCFRNVPLLDIYLCMGYLF